MFLCLINTFHQNIHFIKPLIETCRSLATITTQSTSKTCNCLKEKHWPISTSKTCDCLKEKHCPINCSYLNPGVCCTTLQSPAIKKIIPSYIKEFVKQLLKNATTFQPTQTIPNSTKYWALKANQLDPNGSWEIKRRCKVLQFPFQKMLPVSRWEITNPRWPRQNPFK